MRRGGVGSRPHRFLGFLFAVLAISQVACNGEDDRKLVIEDNTLGSWIAINNTFAWPAVRDTDKLYHWSGILFQIGDFPSAHYDLAEITFSTEGSTIRTLSRSDYSDTSGKAFWINIVSRERNATHQPPMDPGDVLALYPGPYPTGPCSSIPTSIPPICLRTAQLHAGMDRVIGLITYWQGANGFELEAKQAENWLGSSFEFRLKDDFKVAVYEINTATSPRTVTPVGTPHDYGTIDLVTVKKHLKGPSDGDKQDPPWHPPPP